MSDRLTVIASKDMSILKDWQRVQHSRMGLQLSRLFNVVPHLLSSHGIGYPFQGIFFLLKNAKQLLPIFLSVVIYYTLLHFYIHTMLYVTPLPLNLAISTLSVGPRGVQIACWQTFQQFPSLNNYIFKNYILEGKLNKSFDTTLSLTGLDTVVIPGKLKGLVSQTMGAQIMEINPLNAFFLFSFFFPTLLYESMSGVIPIFRCIASQYNSALRAAENTQLRMWISDEQTATPTSLPSKRKWGTTPSLWHRLPTRRVDPPCWSLFPLHWHYWCSPLN